jgi:hypothetical protein
LTRFHGCFDHDAVLCLHHDCHLDFGCEVGTVAAAARDDRGLDDLVAGRGRRSRREPQAVPIVGGDDVIKWGKRRLPRGSSRRRLIGLPHRGQSLGEPTHCQVLGTLGRQLLQQHGGVGHITVEYGVGRQICFAPGG